MEVTIKPKDLKSGFKSGKSEITLGFSERKITVTLIVGSTEHKCYRFKKIISVRGRNKQGEEKISRKEICVVVYHKDKAGQELFLYMKNTQCSFSNELCNMKKGEFYHGSISSASGVKEKIKFITSLIGHLQNSGNVTTKRSRNENVIGGSMINKAIRQKTLADDKKIIDVISDFLKMSEKDNSAILTDLLSILNRPNNDPLHSSRQYIQPLLTQLFSISGGKKQSTLQVIHKFIANALVMNDFDMMKDMTTVNSMNLTEKKRKELDVLTLLSVVIGGISGMAEDSISPITSAQIDEFKTLFQWKCFDKEIIILILDYILIFVDKKGRKNRGAVIIAKQMKYYGVDLEYSFGVFYDRSRGYFSDIRLNKKSNLVRISEIHMGTKMTEMVKMHGLKKKGGKSEKDSGESKRMKNVALLALFGEDYKTLTVHNVYNYETRPNVRIIKEKWISRVSENVHFEILFNSTETKIGVKEHVEKLMKSTFFRKLVHILKIRDDSMIDEDDEFDYSIGEKRYVYCIILGTVTTESSKKRLQSTLSKKYDDVICRVVKEVNAQEGNIYRYLVTVEKDEALADESDVKLGFLDVVFGYGSNDEEERDSISFEKVVLTGSKWICNISSKKSLDDDKEPLEDMGFEMEIVQQ